MKEYKILEFSAGMWAGRIKPDKLEESINEFAEKGWIVKTSLSYSTADVDCVLIILERDAK